MAAEGPHGDSALIALDRFNEAAARWPRKGPARGTGRR